MNKNISYNRTAIVNQNGTVSSMTISRALSIGMLVETSLNTTFLGEENDRPNYFYVIPLTEGTIKVRLVGGRRLYDL